MVVPNEELKERDRKDFENLFLFVTDGEDMISYHVGIEDTHQTAMPSLLWMKLTTSCSRIHPSSSCLCRTHPVYVSLLLLLIVLWGRRLLLN
jgi:hypothetical protein